MPLVIGNRMIVAKGFTLGQNDVVSVYEIDEPKVNINQFELNADAIKRNMLSMLCSNQNQIKFLKSCYEAGKGYIFRYISKDTGHTVEIKFSKEELESIVTSLM